MIFIPSGAREPLRIAVMANASLRCALISPNTSIIDALRSKRQRISCLVDRNCLLSLAGFMVLARQQRSRSLAFAGEIVIGAVFNHGSARDDMSLGMHEDRLQSRVDEY